MPGSLLFIYYFMLMFSAFAGKVYKGRIVVVVVAKFHCYAKVLSLVLNIYYDLHYRCVVPLG